MLMFVPVLFEAFCFGMVSTMKKKTWTIKKGQIKNLDKTFDYQFWQSQPQGSRSLAAWELAVHYHVNVKGENAKQLRLQRSVAVLKPLPR